MELHPALFPISPTAIEPDPVVPGPSVVNVASVPMRSPFRYPGGKTWLVPYIRQWLGSRPTPVAELIEPFAGGGIVSLTALFENFASCITLVELDMDIASVWHTVVNGRGRELAEAILTFPFSEETVRAAVARSEASLYDRAFATILRNRVNRGGILAPGASFVKQGENGRGLSSRWYPETLHRRITDIVEKKNRIRFIQGDGIEYVQRNSTREDVAFFIDPPYTIAGRRLYAHFALDHDRLFQVVAGIAGDFLMTYDDTQEIRDLAARHGFHTRTVPMKNTHHARKEELLIGRDLSWLKPLADAIPGLRQSLGFTPPHGYRET